MTTELSRSEMRSHGVDANHEICGVCSKDIYFTYCMTRSDYVYKKVVNGKTIYYCGYNHFRSDKPEDKPKSKFKEKGVRE